MSDLIELTETWAAKITICSNSEMVCDGIDVEPFEKEITEEAVGAAQNVITAWTPHSESADEDCRFKEWNGGKYYNATYRTRFVVAELYHREPEPVGEEELTYGEWEWMDRKETPKILQAGIAELIAEADDAMDKALDAANERIKKENEEFAKEEAEANADDE